MLMVMVGVMAIHPVSLAMLMAMVILIAFPRCAVGP